MAPKDKGRVWSGEAGWMVTEPCEDLLFCVLRGDDLVVQVMVVLGNKPEAAIRIVPGDHGVVDVDDQAGIWIPAEAFVALRVAMRMAYDGYRKKQAEIAARDARNGMMVIVTL